MNNNDRFGGSLRLPVCTLKAVILLAGVTFAAPPQVRLQDRSLRFAESTPQVIDFERLPAGTILSSVRANRGAGPIGVLGSYPPLGNVNAAVVFDSSHPTGGDADLGSPNEDFGGPGIGVGGSAGSPFENTTALGKVLIIAEDLVDGNGDGLVDDPDDADSAGPLTLDFAAIAPVTLKSVTVIDIDGQSGGTPRVDLFDELGHEVGSVPLPMTGNNGAAVVDLGDVSGVWSIKVRLRGSGAIDDIVFARDCAAWIGDLVWNDLDRDGIQDQDEPGLEGVRVLLGNHLGTEIGSTVSDSEGAYIFEDLCEGTYQVRVDLSSLRRDLLASDCDVGQDDRIDSDCPPATVLLPSRTASNTSVDFGYNAPCSGSIGNFLWHDQNENGIQDFDEPGLVGVKIDLFDDLGVLIESKETGTNGVFSFDGLCQGTYRLEVDESTLPLNFEVGACDVGGDDNVDSDCSPIDIVLPTDFTDDTSVDFGYTSPFVGSIGDFVFLDFDCDGLQDLDGFQAAADAGLASVGLILRDNMNVVVQTTNSGNGVPNLHGYLGTNEIGRYRFTGLPSGVYFVEVNLATLPPGLVPSPCDPGIDDEIDNDCTNVMVVLVNEDVTESFDFGFRQEPCDGFGCRREFWRDPANFDLWPAPLTPDTLFADYFDDIVVNHFTFEQVLNLGSGGLNGLRREAVTALLNAVSPVDFALAEDQVLTLYNDLFPGGLGEAPTLTEYLRALNDQTCPLEGM